MFGTFNSGTYVMTKSDSTFLEDNTRNMLSCRFAKILHDPECQNQCCSNSLEKLMQSNNHDLNQLHFPLEVVTPTTSENEFLFNTTTFYDTQVPECHRIIGQVEEDLGIINSKLYDSEPTKSEQYIHFCKSGVNTERNPKNSSKVTLKRKRKRTVFTTEQIIVMEGVFKKRPYVSKEERLLLTQKLNVSEKAIKIWFQNRRRVTEKTMKRESYQPGSCNSDSTSTIEDIFDAHSARLDYIEYKINQSTDEFGLVTLDDSIISEIVDVIDHILSHRIDFDSQSHENQNIKSESYLMYEPISPESLSEENQESENISEWKPSEPEESLQRLIDIQNVLYTHS